jgi:hypothetical protein
LGLCLPFPFDRLEQIDLKRQTGSCQPECALEYFDNLPTGFDRSKSSGSSGNGLSGYWIGGGVSVNNIRESNFQRIVTTNDLLFGKHLLLRKGKKNYAVVTVK